MNSNSLKNLIEMKTEELDKFISKFIAGEKIPRWWEII